MTYQNLHKEFTNMKLQEEFKLFERMWDGEIVPKTSTLEIHTGAHKGNKIVDKQGVPHIEAYKELVKTLKGLPAEDMYELDIWWMLDKNAPGDKAGDAVLYVDAATTAIEEIGVSPDECSNGYSGGQANPANRLVFACGYDAEELGLPRYAYDYIEGLLDVDTTGGAN
jgi:hypothetical protein